ncbi:MAG: hypothetical protein DI601_21160 [Azospirillum brasilense]|nr:MAG: hypothetical protein DI601_21160 [Azospirillum brasilense]
MATLDWESFMTKKPKGPDVLSVPGNDGNSADGAPPATPRRRVSPKSAELFQTVGRKVIELRKTVGWTQAQLAREAQCPVSTVFETETGVHNVSLGTLQRIADALKVEIRDLMPGSDTPRPGSAAPPEIAPAPAAQPNPATLETNPAMLKLVEGALQTTLTEMGRVALLIQQVNNLVSGLQTPIDMKDRTGR